MTAIRMGGLLCEDLYGERLLWWWMGFCFLFAIGWLVGTFGVVVVVVVVRFGWMTPNVGGMGVDG